MEKQSLLAIKQNKLLKNIDTSILNFNNIKGQLKTFNQGGILYREGFKADSVLLIISGEINILKKNLYGKTQSLIFTDNDCFGFNEIIDGGIRTSTAVALRDSYVIELSVEEMDALMSQSSEIEKNILSGEQSISLDNIAEKAKSIEHDLETAQFDIDETSLNNLLDENFDEESEIDELEDLTENEPEEIVTPETNFDELIPNEAIIDEFETTEDVIEEDVIEEDDHFHLNEPKDQSEVNIVTEADDEIPKDVYAGKNSISKTVNENSSENEIPNLSEEDEAFFAGLENDTFPNPNDHAFIPEDEIHQQSSDDIIDEINLKMNDRFGYEDEYPTEIIKEDVLEENLFEESSEKPNEITSEELMNETNNEESLTPEIPEEQQTANLAPQKIEEEKVEQVIPQESKELTSEQLRMINKAAHSVTSNVKIEEVLNNIVEAACELTCAERGTLYLVDQEVNELWSKITTESEVREIRLKIGEGIAGWVAKSGEIVNITNVDEDQRFKRDYDKSSGYKTKNMLCFPLKNKDKEIIGVIQLLNSKNGFFSSKDEQFLDALSAHASAALINAELVEKLLKSERVTSLGKMANFLIQDIKKPVLVSKRYAEHLISKELPKDVKQVLEMMLEQLNHVSDIVQTTSSYSEGKSVLRAINISLNETLDDYINRVDTYLRNKGCSITTQYDLDVNVKIDLKEFFQCFNHLVKNACDAMPDGGSIVISTAKQNNKVELSFKDSGLGIPDSIIDKIFEPFMTHGKKEGTGLGLSITKKIVEDHSGTIDVSSDLGEGTIFTITLPVVSSF